MNNWLNLIAITGLLIGNLSTFIYFTREQDYEDQKIKELLLEDQIKSQRAYYQGLYQSEQEIRKTEHDFKNIFLALSGDAKAEDLDGIKRYLKEVGKNAEELKPLINTQHLALDALISSKLTLAKEHTIAFKTKITLPLKDLSVDEMDLCVFR